MAATARKLVVPAGVDGRMRRSMRSADLIAGALYDLVGEGHLEPTAQQVADHAGVGIRSVFRLFSDMDALHATIGSRLDAQVAAVLRPIPDGAELDRRVAGLVAERAEIFERFGPYIRATRHTSVRSPFLRAQYQKSSDRLRARLLDWLPEVEVGAIETLEAVDQAASFEAWDRLRTYQNLGYERARSVMQLTVLALIEPRREAAGRKPARKK